MISRGPIIPWSPASDHTGKEGYFVELSGSNIEICNSAADIPVGLITEGFPVGAKDSIALPSTAEPVKVKLSATPGTITPFTYGVLATDGAKADPGTGARVRVCRFIEAGVAGELVQAYLVEPTALT